MNLSTDYLGLDLPSPLVIGASPLADNLETARLLQDMGAGAIVMRSLFEEQIYLDALESAPGKERSKLPPNHWTTHFPSVSEYQLTPDRYLLQIDRLKASIKIPVVASLNGCRPGGWIDFAARCEKAGADAIEINLYNIAADPAVSPAQIEADMIEIVRLVRESVRIPVAVKLSCFHTSPAHFARQLELAGANGIVIFNRTYQAELNHEEEQEELMLQLSTPSELILRLRWLAILSPNLKCSMAATGGIHSGGDLIKAILAGADAVQVVSAILKHGPRYVATMIESLQGWMDTHNYASVSEFCGAMNLDLCLDPAAFERASYQRLLQKWRI